MKGADKYCTLFKETQQINRLYLVVAEHARGKTFHIFVLPKDEKAIPNGSMNAPLNKDAVEVYGVVAGNPGWTESYGWLHNGSWQDDFKNLVNKRIEVVIEANETVKDLAEKNKEQEAIRIRTLLNTY